MTDEHPSLTLPKPPIPEPIVETLTQPQVDLSGVEARAKRIVETVQQLVSDVEARLDGIEEDVLLLVKAELEKRK